MKRNINIEINEKLDRLLKAQEENETMLPFDDACKYLFVSKSTLYHLVSEGKVGYYKPNGKLIYFSRAQLNKFIKGRKSLKKF
ncbi:MAG: helix-turn-helix domain-containing protein [Ignavibacteria bacterium]